MNKPEPATSLRKAEQTEVGSVFVSNYPPYSCWREGVDLVTQALDAAPLPAATLGLYLHIPFCRRRCNFCYFRVFTDKNSRDVTRYLDAMAVELEMLAPRPAVQGRPLKFVYFGGGTPSYISARHLRSLAERLKRAIPWDGVDEVAFECEPGTLTEAKVEAIREIGVTRLSLGVENFNDQILSSNGRAHVSKEIHQCLPWIRAQGFNQLNIDLIAGMIGETGETWRDSVQKTIDLDADSVTIYQLELPFNTVYSKQLIDGEGLTVADWALKREWHGYAIEQLEAAGYEVSSAYTMVKQGGDGRFVYRNSVWQGTDMLGVGVSSFSHLSGVHYQNQAGWDPYLERVEAGKLPVDRAYPTSEHERLTREMILQLKLGRIETGYFERKFGVRILEVFASAFRELENEGMLTADEQEIRLTRKGLLQVDGLLPMFYAPEFCGARYT